MHAPDLSRYIRHSTEEVLETMFFTSVQSDDLGVRPAAPLISSSLNFRGTPSGRFQLDVSEEAARNLAADFLGDDGNGSPAPVCEIVGELANMLCGSVLSRTGSETVFELSSPVPGVQVLDDRAVRHSFQLPGGSLTVSIQIEDAP